MHNKPSLSEYDLIITLLVGIIIFISLASFIILFTLLYQKRKRDYYNEKERMRNQFKQEILQSQHEAQEYSFNQISGELHDNIGQLLSSTKMLLSALELQMIEIPDIFRTAEETLSKAIQDLRSLSKSLSKEWLNQFSLIENLQAEIERINASRQIEVRLITNTKTLLFGPEGQVMLFRVVQEALQNSIKHANAKHIEITISNTDNCLRITIQDDGEGFDFIRLQNESLGLRSMRHRTNLLGGKIEWVQGQENGTVVVITLPFNNQS